MKKLFTIIFIIFSSAAFAQKITGRVSDDKGPLPGVTVYEKGAQQNGAATDAGGKFTLTLKGTSKTLMFTAIGYTPKEVALGASTTISVTMIGDTKGLNEVVVLGYAVQKKITNIGAVSAISGDDIRQTPVANIQNTLMGRVPGVTTVQTSGKPGSDGASISIRGVSTYAGGAGPLIMVDDVEYPGSINEIDADQVESVSVLKDASTTAIYGVKGANGVILITTRRGKAGMAKFTVKNELGLEVPTKLPQYVDSYNAALLTNTALTNDGLPAKFTANDLALFQNGTDPYGHPNVNWEDVLLKKVTVQNRTNMDIQGGSEKMKYFVSGGYLFQNGIINSFSQPDGINDNFYYKRYNVRSNIDLTLTKTTTLSVDFAGTFGEQNSPNSLGKNGNLTNNIFLEIKDYTSLPPFAYPVFNPNGTYSYNPAYPTNIVGRIATGGYIRTFQTDLVSNIKLNQKLDFITQGLSAKLLIGFNAQFAYERDLTRTVFPAYTYNSTTGIYTTYNNGSAYVTRLDNLTLSYNPTAAPAVPATNYIYRRLNTQASLNYDHSFGGSHVYGLALFNQYDNITTANVPISFRGVTARLGYDFKKRYLFEFNGSYNGSSLFPATGRYGYFPAASVGWNIAEEGFFKKTAALNFINMFKLRGTYGIVGSDRFNVSGDYAYIQTYPRSTTTANIGTTPNVITPILEGPAGSNITWEKEKQTNIGIDLLLFDSKLAVTGDYFQRSRYDILTTRQDIPALFGNTTNAVNIGRVQNRGFEVDVKYNGKAGKVSYAIDANISVAKNKILYESEAAPQYDYQALTGHPIGSSLGYTWIGYYTAADIADATVAKPVSSVVVHPGDLKYKDTNGDGVVDVNDRTVFSHTNTPNTILGTTLSASYKGFSITATLQSGLNYSLQGGSAEVNPFQNNFRTIHQNYWTPDNQSPDFPRLTSITNSLNNALNYVSDYWYRRADYMRLKTAQISYSLPQSFIKKMKVLDGARIYLSGYNLFTVWLKQKSKFDIDPESISGTGDEGTYPQQKVFNVGLQLSF